MIGAGVWWVLVFLIQSLTCIPTLSFFSTQGDASALTGYESENLLALRWKIYEPVVTYDELQFDLVFNVSDYIIQNYVGYKVYDTHECSDGANSNDITDEAYFDGVITVNGASSQEDGWGTREVTLATIISPEDIRISNSYIQDGNDAHIDFCVRFSLFNNDPSDPASIEINFVEQKITLYVDLTDGFSVSDTVVEAKEVTQKTDTDAFFVIAFLCTETGNEMIDPGPFEQGEIVRVCVEPTIQAYVTGLRMRRIDWFTWTRDDIPVSQEAIVGSLGSLNGLTDLFCELGSVQCSFESLLNSLFFESPGITSGAGSATMQFGAGSGSRFLHGDSDSYRDRDLQSASPRSILIPNFVIEPVEDGLLYLPSSRASRRAVLISALLVLSAFFIL
jgi:hypothetical protein